MPGFEYLIQRDLMILLIFARGRARGRRMLVNYRDLWISNFSPVLSGVPGSEQSPRHSEELPLLRGPLCFRRVARWTRKWSALGVCVPGPRENRSFKTNVPSPEKWFLY